MRVQHAVVLVLTASAGAAVKHGPLGPVHPTGQYSVENWCQLLNQCLTGLAFVFPYSKIIGRTSSATSNLTSDIDDNKK